MREITRKILVVVIIACFVSLVGMFLLVRNTNRVTERYQNIGSYRKNQDVMEQISSDIYRIENLMYTHILSADETIYVESEREIEELKDRINDLLDELDSSMKDREDKDILHQVSVNYLGFTRNMDVVLEFSRQGSMQTAFYYMERLAPYISNVNQLFADMNDRVELRATAETNALENVIAALHVSEIVCMIVVLVIIVICIFLVFLHGRRIVDRQEEELKSHQQKVMDLQYSTIVGMANLIESRDGETGGHVKRTGRFVDLIVHALAEDSEYSDKIDEAYMENLWKTAPLHDIGKIKISDAILQKPGRLTKEEFEVIKTHTTAGGEIINDIMGEIEEPEYLEMLHDMAQYHHEKWDGSGYPEGLSGEQIPLCARIMAVADVFDALISKRCYKEPMSLDEAYQIIMESSGTHFDPVIVKKFVELRPIIEEFLSEF